MEASLIRIGIVAVPSLKKSSVQVPSDQTLGDIVHLQRRQLNVVETSKLPIVFYTWDSEGEKAVGKLSALVKDVLKDGDIIFQSWLRFPFQQWEKISGKIFLTYCKTCQISIKNQDIFILIEYESKTCYCEKCFQEVLKRKDLQCCNCGEKDCLLIPDQETGKHNIQEYTAKCRIKCVRRTIILRECSHCGLPLKKVNYCGRCKRRMYCGTDCQKKDWPTHKVTCQ